jgi:hypothetical protein
MEALNLDVPPRSGEPNQCLAPGAIVTFRDHEFVVVEVGGRPHTRGFGDVDFTVFAIAPEASPDAGTILNTPWGACEIVSRPAGIAAPASIPVIDPLSLWQHLNTSQQQQIGVAAIIAALGRLGRQNAQVVEDIASQGYCAAAIAGEAALDATITQIVLADPALTALPIPPRPSLASLGIPFCRVCGCTDDCACPGQCFWIEEGLCSACRPSPTTLIAVPKFETAIAEPADLLDIDPALASEIADCLAEIIDAKLLTVHEPLTDGPLDLRVGSFLPVLSNRAAELLGQAGR